MWTSEHLPIIAKLMCRKTTLQVFVRAVHGKIVIDIHLLFGTCSKTSPWNPGTYRHKIVRLSISQFGLGVMLKFFQNFSLLASINCTKYENHLSAKNLEKDKIMLFDYEKVT